MARQDKAIRKRQLISKANSNMFIAVAIASVLVGFALVAIVFLFNKISFNALVIKEKNSTLATLKQNIKNVKELETDVKVLRTNDALLSVRISPDQDALKVVLDALPASGNTSTLGASLKDRLLAVPNLSIDSLSVDLINDAPASLATTLTKPSLETAPSQMKFQFKIVGNINDLNLALKNLERSIRAISVDTISFEASEDKSALSVTGHAYYLPMQEARLGTKVVETKQ